MQYLDIVTGLRHSWVVVHCELELTVTVVKCHGQNADVHLLLQAEAVQQLTSEIPAERPSTQDLLTSQLFLTPQQVTLTYIT